MKREELRIGNLVEYEGEIFTMNFLSKEGPPILDTLRFGYGVVEWRDLKPVPLTEEWLLKFGFETKKWRSQDGLIDLWIKGNGNIYFELQHNGDNYEYDWTTIIEVKYVHSLQNLYFALTGKELTIKELTE